MLNMHANTFTSPENMTFCNIGVTGDLHGLLHPMPVVSCKTASGISGWKLSGGLDFLSYKRPDFQMLEFDTSRDGKAVGKQVWGIAFDNRGRLWVGGENEVGYISESQPLEGNPAGKRKSCLIRMYLLFIKTGAECCGSACTVTEC